MNQSSQIEAGVQAGQLQNVVNVDDTASEPFHILEHELSALALRPSGIADAAFFAALDEQIAARSAFFDNAPLVLDLERVQDAMEVAQLRSLLEQLRRRRVSLIGLRNGNRAQNAVAKAAGLIAMRASKSVAEPEPVVAPAPVAQAAEQGGTVTITEPVRSGQKIFAEHGDLVVLAPVSAGAELVAVGNIHVYGALRGRALAGVRGDAGARIFCQNFAAELVAIAGLYQTSEDFDGALLRKPVHAFLKDDRLCISALD